MEKILSTIKSQLQESKNRLENNSHTDHDIFPWLLLTLVELLEKNSSDYKEFIDDQRKLVTKEITYLETSTAKFKEDWIVILQENKDSFIQSVEQSSYEYRNFTNERKADIDSVISQLDTSTTKFKEDATTILLENKQSLFGLLESIRSEYRDFITDQRKLTNDASESIKTISGMINSMWEVLTQQISKKFMWLYILLWINMITSIGTLIYIVIK